MKKRFCIGAAVLVACAGLISTLTGTSQAQTNTIRTAVVSGGNATSSDVAAQLSDSTAFDFVVTIVTPDQIDSAAELEGFDVVVMGDSGNNDGLWTVAMAEAVRDWVEDGNGIVSTGWLSYATGNNPGNAARDQALDDIMPIDAFPDGTDNYCESPMTIEIQNGSHPVTEGISDFLLSVVEDTESSTIAPDSGVTIATVTSSNCSTNEFMNTVVVGPLGDGRQVYLGLVYFADAGYFPEELRSGPADQLLEQAVAWSAGERRGVVREQPVRPRPPSIGAGLSGLFNGQPTPLPGAGQAGSAGSSPAAGTSPAATSPVITPPRTGDAGLSSTSTSPLFLPALLVTGGLIGLVTIHIRTTHVRR